MKLLLIAAPALILIVLAVWAMWKGGGPPTDDHGHDLDRVTRYGGG